MQVSWIEPEDIASLAEQLRRPRPTPPNAANDALSAEFIAQMAMIAGDKLAEDFASTFGVSELTAPAPVVVAVPHVADESDLSDQSDVSDQPPEHAAEASEEPSAAPLAQPEPFEEEAAPEPTPAPAPSPPQATQLPVLEVTLHLHAAPHAEPDPPITVADVTHSAALNAIRDQLQAIRERAIGAGLLTPQTAFPSAADRQKDDPSAAAQDVIGQEPGMAEDPFEGSENGEPHTGDAPVADMCSFEVPLGSIVQRLDAYAGWALRRLGGGDVLIVDQHGDLLWGPQAKAGLILSTMMACSAAMHASALAACAVPPSIQQPLASGNLLTIIPCRTRLGLLQVAIARPDVVPAHEADLLRQALTVAIDTEGG